MKFKLIPVKTITKQKLELIDTNAEKLLGKLDTNLGIDEANKMLITDAEGKITTAVAGSMSVLVDNLTSSSTTMPLTANQGRVLNNIKLDKQQGVENANKYLYVNDLGLIDLIEKGTGDDELANYLPLTAGIDKKLTGDLYFDNNKFIKGYTTASTLRNLIGVNTASVIELGDVSANINVKAASAFRPAKNNETALGTNALQWKEIYGTTIYQNGKQVATLEDQVSYKRARSYKVGEREN